MTTSASLIEDRMRRKKRLLDAPVEYHPPDSFLLTRCLRIARARRVTVELASDGSGFIVEGHVGLCIDGLLDLLLTH